MRGDIRMEKDIFDSAQEMSNSGGSCSLPDLRKEETFNKDINVKDILKLDKILKIDDFNFEDETIFTPAF